MSFLIPGGGLSLPKGKSVSDFLWGKEGEFKRETKLRPEQEANWQAYQEAVQGGFQEAADYYRKILMDDPETMEMFMKPEMQRFQRETMPGLAEQFAGLGSGGISSSGFQQAAAGAAGDLSERLAKIRADLKQSSAKGMADLSKGALEPQDLLYYQQPDPGFVAGIAPAAGAAAGAYSGVPGGAQVGMQAGQSFGKTNPYGASQSGITVV